MKATWLYRAAAVVFVLFALGHTLGFLEFPAILGRRSRGV